MIDIGASYSLMDIGTIEKLGLDKQIDQQVHHHLIDASGKNMQLIGTVNIDVSLVGFIRILPNILFLAFPDFFLENEVVFPDCTSGIYNIFPDHLAL